MKIKKTAKGLGIAFCIFVTTVMLLFRGDWRVFTGFDLFLSTSSGPIHFHTGDWDAIPSGDLIKTVYVSKVSDRYSFGGNPHTGDKDSVSTIIGPTIITLRSGKVIIAGGVSFVSESRKGQPYSYIEVE